MVPARGEFTLEYRATPSASPRYVVDECKERDLSFSAPLKARLRLVGREEVDGEHDKDIIEQEVYLGELPLITDKGTFIINGAERVIVSQLHRSPGVFFDEAPTRTASVSSRPGSSRTAARGWSSAST